MDLHREINETTTQQDAEDKLFENNCRMIAKRADLKVEKLAESVGVWLEKIAKEVKDGTFDKPAADNTAAMADHAEKMRGTAEIMGAVSALADPDTAEAMNVKDPRTPLHLAYSNDQQSDVAIDYLRGVGRSEAKQQTNRASELLKSRDQQAIMDYIRKMHLQVKKVLGGIQQGQQDQQGERRGSTQQQRQQQPGSLGLRGAMNDQTTI